MNDSALLTEEQVRLITQPTPREHIEFRPGRGGMPLAYVTISHTIQMLNQVFGFNWSVEHDPPIILEASGEVIVPTRLVVHFPCERGMRTVTKGQYGRDDIARNRQGEIVSQGDAIKSAASDGLKKCASLWGMFADVYAGQVSAEVTEPRERERPARAPQTAARALPPMPEISMPANAEDGMATLLEAAGAHFGLEQGQARQILRRAGFRPSHLPEQFTAMLETLREGATTNRVA